MNSYLAATLFASITFVFVALFGGDIRSFVLSPWPGVVAGACVIFGYKDRLQVWKWPLLMIVGGALNYSVVVLVMYANFETEAGTGALSFLSGVGGVLWAIVLRVLLFRTSLSYRRMPLIGVACSIAVVSLLLGERVDGENPFWLALHTGAWWTAFAVSVVWCLSRDGANKTFQQTGSAGS